MKKIIIANWKMNPRTLADALRRFAHIRAAAGRFRNANVVVCPPAVFLGAFHARPKGRVSLGAQNLFGEEAGAYTGEVSPAQLVSMDVSYVILGHSERRAMGETNEDVNRKVRLALEYPLKTVLCIGESVRDKDAAYLLFLKNELKESLARVSRNKVRRLIIAYEPIWAVGALAKKADTPENLLEVVIFIRKTLSDMFGKQLAFSVPILYGGSVTPQNAEGFLRRGGADGLLVGRASLEPKEFIPIVKTAHGV